MSLLRALRVWVVFWFAGAIPAWAQTNASATQGTPAKPVYAVLSVIGDKIDVVVARSLPGQEQAAVRGAVTPTEGVFDAVAVEAASRAIWAVAPKMDIAQLAVRGKSMFEKQTELFAEANGRIRIPAEVMEGARQQAATHLVLLLKHRAPVVWNVPGTAKPKTDAQFRGTVEGLGFVVDVPAGRDGEIVPFLHFQVLVVDLASATVVGRNPVAATAPVPAEAVSADLAWRNFSAWQKTRSLEFLIRDQVMQAVQSLFELIAPPN
ncbi:MAG: hypothetical protein JNJ55_06820 [Betaproteobacteria bacterium]|nr:hypothetical protein [Betaproteobacteria bacterium]